MTTPAASQGHLLLRNALIAIQLGIVIISTRMVSGVTVLGEPCCHRQSDKALHNDGLRQRLEQVVVRKRAVTLEHIQHNKGQNKDASSCNAAGLDAPNLAVKELPEVHASFTEILPLGIVGR